MIKFAENDPHESPKTPNLNLSTPGEYAWRTWALSKIATPKAYAFLRFDIYFGSSAIRVGHFWANSSQRRGMIRR